MARTISLLLLVHFFALSAAAEKIEDRLPPPPEGKAWKLAWNDEFEGARLDETKWNVPPDGKRRDAFWMRKAISLDGKGHLVISTLKEGDRYIDGCVRTLGKFEHTYGYYVARIRFQEQPGHWSAFWLMGRGVSKVGNEGRDGTEIDIMEKPWLDDRVQQTAKHRSTSSSPMKWGNGEATSPRQSCRIRSWWTTCGCTIWSTSSFCCGRVGKS